MEEKNKKIIKITLIVSIIIIVLIGIWLTSPIYSRCGYVSNVQTIDKQTKGDIDNIFAVSDTRLVVGFSHILNIMQGTKDFGIPIAFAANDSHAWGANNEGCKYSIKFVESDCMNKNGILIKNGISNVTFGGVINSVGYSLIKIEVNKEAELCTQRFVITVNCDGYPNETTSTTVDLDILKKKLFC
jgi:hypothetical protein